VGLWPVVYPQVEGLVADYNLTLGNLIGVLNLFFTRLGLSDIKFKPAYNPYTEPSMEVGSVLTLLVHFDPWVQVPSPADSALAASGRRRRTLAPRPC
jgi:hypothetical protein